MTLTQLSALRAWMQAHKCTHPVEYHVWDGVLTLWLMGWMGAPAYVLLDAPWDVLTCAALLWAPPAYVQLRRTLARRGEVRCDWLGALSAAQPTPRLPSRPGG